MIVNSLYPHGQLGDSQPGDSLISLSHYIASLSIPSVVVVRVVVEVFPVVDVVAFVVVVAKITLNLFSK